MTILLWFLTILELEFWTFSRDSSLTFRILSTFPHSDQLTLNKWPLVIGICGACITLAIAILLLRPLTEGTPFVKGLKLIQITRWAESLPSEFPSKDLPILIFFATHPPLTRLLSVSDIPERMRFSPSNFHGMRQHGRFRTGLDGGGSTLMSE